VIDWITSWMSVRGFLDRRSEGVRIARMVDDRDLASVPGMPTNGLTVTSKVAREACSAANRTSIGPETEARALVCPVRKKRLLAERNEVEHDTESEACRTVCSVQSVVRDIQLSQFIVISTI
jgi:hypothetical protein